MNWPPEDSLKISSTFMENPPPQTNCCSHIRKHIDIFKHAKAWAQCEKQLCVIQQERREDVSVTGDAPR